MIAATIRRYLDWRRLCYWTAYAAGTRHARLADQPYPQDPHATRYRVCGNGEQSTRPQPDSQVDLTADSVDVAFECDTTQYEALQVEDAERRISGILGSWARKKFKLANAVKLLWLEARQLGEERRFKNRRHKDKGYRHPSEWPGWLLGIAIAAFALPEYPLTVGGLQVFRLTILDTQVTALGYSWILIFLAHSVGKSLKQKTWGLVPTIFACTVIVSILSLAILRADFLEQSVATHSARVEDEVAAVAEESGAALALPTVVKSLGSKQTLALAALALLFAIGGMALGFHAHDSDPDLNAIVQEISANWRDLRRVLERLGRAAAAYDGLRGSVEEHINAEQERALMVVREYRFASELWRSPTLNRPDSFGLSADQRLFKKRDVGPELLPLVVDLEAFLSQEDVDPRAGELDTMTRRLWVASMEAEHVPA